MDMTPAAFDLFSYLEPGCENALVRRQHLLFINDSSALLVVILSN